MCIRRSMCWGWSILPWTWSMLGAHTVQTVCDAAFIMRTQSVQQLNVLPVWTCACWLHTCENEHAWKSQSGSCSACAHCIQLVYWDTCANWVPFRDTCEYVRLEWRRSHKSVLWPLAFTLPSWDLLYDGGDWTAKKISFCQATTCFCASVKAKVYIMQILCAHST